MSPTPIESIPTLVSELRQSFKARRTRPVEWRIGQLRRLAAMLEEREDVFLDALKADLGKCRFEAVLTETAFVLSEIEAAIKHLPGWMKPERVSTPLVQQPGHAMIQRDPLGVALIIAPWNYPVQLLLAPLVGALAAGNCVVLKPSEVAPHTSEAIARWVPEYLDPSCVRVVEGGVAETTALLKEKYDHIFFTGGGTVGRVVMRAAAEHLTPVTLELGGKSPCIVDSDVDLDVAARRIVWGKFINAGQTCIAPDYILACAPIHDALLERMKACVRESFGADPSQSPDFGRIINERHHRRLMKLIDSGDIVTGGQNSETDRYIAPTILKNVSRTLRSWPKRSLAPSCR